MKLLRACLILLIIFAAFATHSAAAAISPAPLPEKAQPSHLLSPAAEQLTQQLQSLQSLVTPIPPPPTSTETPVLDEPVFDPAPTFGTRALNIVIAILDLVGEQAHAFVTNLSALPQISTWYAQQQSDARLHDRWTAIGDGLLQIILPTALGAIALEILFLPLRNLLRRREPQHISGRATVLGTIFFIRIISIAVFVAVSSVLLNDAETQKLPRYILLNIVYALALGRLVFVMLRSLLSPSVPTLRLFPLTSRQALYAFRWIGAFSFLIISGYFSYDLARVVHVPDSAIVAFVNIFGIVLVGMTIVVIRQTREYVSALLHRNIPEAATDRTWFEQLRLWLDRYWQTLAISYLLIGYLFTALDVQNGFFILLRGTIATLAIIVAMRLALGFIKKLGKKGRTQPLHVHALRLVARLAVWLLSFAGVIAAWGADIPALMATPLGQRVTGSAFSVGSTIVILAAIYEWISSSIDRHISRKNSDGMHYASSRTRTLLPMLRNTILLVFAAAAALVTFSEAGFNIAPLLAGAGVLGVAIGFGSQTLVKDFLTGLFIVAENTIAIGDVIKIGEHRGVVEAMSMRTLRLRDGETGDLHILPFSETTNITNMTKNFGYAPIKVGVAYNTDLERAAEVMREVGDELKANSPVSSFILDPIEVMGVEALGDYSITLFARLRTLPGKQWDVRRMYLLKLKQRFDKEGIEIPYPTVTQLQQPTK